LTGVFLLAWVVFPALLLILSTGAGLGLRRISGAQVVPGILIVPLGLAVLVVVAGFFCYFASLAPLAGPALAVVGVLGLLLGRDQIRAAIGRRGRGLDLWALAAAVGAWAIIAAPVVLSGKPGFTGYAHIVDISYEFDLAAHFAHSGRSIPVATGSAYHVVLAKYLAAGYPGGAVWTLGSLSNLMPVDLSWLYQPFLAFLAAISALSLYSLLGRLIESRAMRALAAFVAAQPNVLVAYALAGGVKELSTISFLLLLAASVAVLLKSLAPGRAALPVSVALAATFAAFSLTTVPWIGVLMVGVFLTSLAFRRDRVRLLLAAAQIAVVGFVLSLPTLAAAQKLLPVVKGAGPTELGNLSAPVPGITAAGVWISGDIRFPQYAHKGLSETIAILVIALAVAGLIFAVRRRAWTVAWLGIAGVVALYYVAHRYGPWIQFKADCITSSIVLALAFVGIGGLMRMRRGVWLAALPVAAVAGGVLAGNALLYHDVTLSPYARLHNLEYIGERFAGQGPTLTPDFEEYAEYYLRDDEQDSVVNGPALGLRAGVNRAAEPGGIFAYDLNEFDPNWVESFRTIVMRRDPLATRPPSNYRLAYVSTYYEVWQRDKPASTVYLHIPLADQPGRRDAAACLQAAASARKVGPSAQIAYMSAPSGYVQLDSSNTTLSGALGNGGGAIIASGAGQAVREQPIPVAGRYDFFMGGSIGRPVNVLVDGRHVGTAAYQVSYPDQWILIGSAWLSRGVHRIAMTRGGVSLHPGNGDGVDGFNRTIGPLVITPVQPAVPVVHYASAAQLAGVCRSSQSLRWLEVVRPT
jgi:hypothetical protein